MKLIIAIIQDSYSNKVVKSLNQKKIRTTKLASTGGFLKSGNTTLLIGVKEEKLDQVVELIKENCKSKKVTDGNEELTVSGANLFVIDVKENFRF